MKTDRSEARLIRVRGRVQGVGFRWSLAEQAVRCGLQGWVRNCGDGTVEALVWGGAEAVAALLFWASLGPPAARVDELSVERVDERPPGFQRLPNA